MVVGSELTWTSGWDDCGPGRYRIALTPGRFLGFRAADDAGCPDRMGGLEVGLWSRLAHR